jgi:hypothetical protein
MSPSRCLSILPRILHYLVLPLALGFFVSSAQANITVGPGPVIGTDSAGNTYFEEFLDWSHSDIRALSPVGALGSGRYNFTGAADDGLNDSRDLMAFYSRIEGSRVFFRVDLFNLLMGAENNGMDLYVAINTGSTTAALATWLPDFTDVQVSESASGITGGWHLCLALYSSPFWAIYDGNYTRMAERNNAAPTGSWASSFVGFNNGPYYNADLDSIEFGIERSLLLDRGWNGTSPLKFWVATTRDGTNGGAGEITGGFGPTSDVTDTFKDPGRGFDDGVINGAILSTDQVGRAKFASIAHANQSVNKAADIVTHVYEPNIHHTGFVRALDTHEIFRIPLNMHFSGSLITALLWAETPKSNAVELKQDGPLFLQRVARLIDPNQTSVPFSLVGGVYAEHIMPYLEGEKNRISMDLFEELSLKVFGVGAEDMKVMHVPERVIRSQTIPNSLGPLTGETFADILATTYSAIYLDEVTHYHHWFDSSNTNWSGNGGSGDAPNQHKIHKINGVYTFLINDREDQAKFANDDQGAKLDMRFTLIDKALQSDQAQITIVFDDWEALAGKSFDPFGGDLVPNNNQMQYQRSMRWIANKQWVEVVNLKDVLDRATDTSHPQYDANWVIDHGNRYNLPIETYEWLKQATEGSYHNWYYNMNNMVMGNEQDYYNLIPVLLGRQGDYRLRRNAQNIPLTNFIQAQPLANRSQEANLQDIAMGATFLPSGKRMGDLNTSNSILHDAWVDIRTAPDNPLKRLGMFSFSSMMYETGWHEEDNGNYANTTFQNPFPNPDVTWDGLNEWCARLNNHVRGVGYLAYAARWAEDVRTGTQGPAASVVALDLDQDGEDEWVLRNNKVLAIFQRHGGRMLHAFHYHPLAGPLSVIGSPVSNPSEPGEEERDGSRANRCSALKDMNTGNYVDAPYTVQPGVPNSSSIRLTSPDGLIVKTVSLQPHLSRLDVEYQVSPSLGALYLRIGASPNNLDLLQTGQQHLTTQLSSSPAFYAVRHTGGAKGGVWVSLDRGAQYNPTPAFSGFRNRNISLTEEIEIFGSGNFHFGIAFEPGDLPVSLSEYSLD